MAKRFSYVAHIQLQSITQANIVASAIGADPELRPEEVDRKIYVEEDMFVMHLSANDLKTLRTAVGSLYDFIRVSLLALAEFSPPSAS